MIILNGTIKSLILDPRKQMEEDTTRFSELVGIITFNPEYISLINRINTLRN